MFLKKLDSRKSPFGNDIAARPTGPTNWNRTACFIVVPQILRSHPFRLPNLRRFFPRRQAKTCLDILQLIEGIRQALCSVRLLFGREAIGRKLDFAQPFFKPRPQTAQGRILDYRRKLRRRQFTQQPRSDAFLFVEIFPHPFPRSIVRTGWGSIIIIYNIYIVRSAI
jgi:hypothetical protein